MTPQAIADLIAKIPAGATPAPWFVSGVRVKRDRAVFHSVMSTAPKEEAIALAFYDERQHRTCWHDAHLIALAPELAAAVRALAEENARLKLLTELGDDA